MTFGDALHAGRENNFNLLRIIAAVSVMVVHAFLIADSTAVPDSRVPLFMLTWREVLLGFFFSMSGFLVGASRWRRDGALDYLVLRFLRILPVFLLAIGLCLFIIGPLFASVSAGQFLADPAVWRWAFGSITMTGLLEPLPHVFNDNRMLAGAMLWPLWSLPVECIHYLIIALPGMVWVLGRAWVLAAVMGIFAIVWVFVLIPYAAGDPFFKFQLDFFSMTAPYFFAGTTLFACRHVVSMRWYVGAAIWALVFLAGWIEAAVPGYPPLREPLEVMGITWLTMRVGFTGWLPHAGLRWFRYNDLSYGVYVLHVPVQQTLYGVAPFLPALAIFAITTPVAVAAGYATWRWIEKPALSLRLRLPGQARVRKH